jgi:uridylate kinase
VRDAGVELAVLVGGGNVFRGTLAEEWGIERAEADNIGMLGTVINGLMLRGVLQARSAHEVRVMTAIPIQSVAEPFIRLRAISHLERGAIVVLAGGIGQPYVTTDYPAVQRAVEVRAEAVLAAKDGVDGVYDADPSKVPGARRIPRLTYDDAVRLGVRVMDQSAFLLAREHGMPIHVFGADQPGAMTAILRGEDVGTTVAA